MAHTLSANKRIRQSAKRRERNRDRKRAVRTEMKKVDALIVKGDTAAAETEIKKAMQVIDRVSAKGSLHRNTAARRKSVLARRLNALKAKGAA